MDSKKLNAYQISELLGIERPPEIKGGTIHIDWIKTAISVVPGCEAVDTGLEKVPLLRAGIEELGGSWDDTCHSGGSTVTAVGLSRFAICIDPRLNEMREIWSLLGKDGYPGVDHKRFVSTLYGHYFDRETEGDTEISIQQILFHVDENHGLSDEEITIQGEPTVSSYQVIMNNLLNDSSESEVEDDEEVRRFLRTEVEAMQIAGLVRYAENGILDLSPPWQRGFVWPPKKRKAVIESIMLGIPLPAIILHKIEENGRIKKIEVIDGQQRLRSIVSFMKNEFPLAKFPSSPRHELVEESGCYWDHPRKKSLDVEWHASIETAKLPIMWFVNVKPKTLRKVFNLYNTAATRLNAAEIRNATYQTHPIHQMAFTLAGENPDSEIFYVDEEDYQKEFTSDWRDLGSTKRFAATELICQYFAYSRPERSLNSNVFKGTSTANSINRYLDLNNPSSSQEVEELAKELIESYYFAEEYFDLDDGENYSFERNDKNGVAKPNKLVTITNLVASRILKIFLDKGIVSENAVMDAIQTVIPSVEFPDNQNAATIWGYQADVINNLLHHLDIRSDDSDVIEIFPKLVPCMDEIRTPNSD